MINSSIDLASIPLWSPPTYVLDLVPLGVEKHPYLVPNMNRNANWIEMVE